MERGESEVGVNGPEEIEPAHTSVPLQRWRCAGIEKVKNVARRVAVLEVSSEWVITKILLCAPFIRSQSIIKYKLEVGG